ncbi:alpha/beta fold hydrolase [Clavibacter zhangzhiyongii]|nr:alpha/beta fold hydrolase [Clavibacter zhangzhiyongii]
MTTMHIARFGTDTSAAVLLLHGGGVAGWMWTSLRQHLESTHLVLVPDLPGHGNSADEPYRAHAATVDALATMLSRNAEGPVAVIGFSLGAQLAMQLASEHPHLVSRAMIVSAQARPIPFTRLTLNALAISAPLARRRWFARLQARELFIPPKLMEDYIATSAAITRPTLLKAVEENMRFQIPTEWPAFPGVALVLAGRKERAVMRESATATQAALPGSALELVDGAGRGLPLQCAEWFNARVSTWLSASTPAV